MRRLTASIGFLVALGAADAYAQPFTPTRAFAPPARLEFVDAEKKLVESDLRNPRIVIDGALTEVRVIRGSLTDPKQTAALRMVERDLRGAVVDLSVADRPDEWAAALRKATTALQEVGKLEMPPVVAERIKAVAGAATELSNIHSKGIPANFPVTGRAAHYLPAAGVGAGTTAPEVKIQIADLFFSNHWRLYLRSMLRPTTPKPESENDNDDSEASGDDGAGEEAEETQPDDTVRSALLDPYGGMFYASTGYFRKLRTPFLNGDANDAEHGLFVDGRVGLKVVELPEETLTLVDGKTAVTPFWTASGALRLILPVYKDNSRSTHAGGVEFALTLATSRISNRSASALFVSEDGEGPRIPPTVNTAHFSVGLALTELANIAVSGTLWSNARFDRRFVVEVNLVRPKEEEKPTSPPSR